METPRGRQGVNVREPLVFLIQQGRICGHLGFFLIKYVPPVLLSANICPPRAQRGVLDTREECWRLLGACEDARWCPTWHVSPALLVGTLGGIGATKYSTKQGFDQHPHLMLYNVMVC